MIRNSKQNWAIGQTVRVGFLTLKVRATIKNTGTELPDGYILSNIEGTQLYNFIPHNGVHKITPNEARDFIKASELVAEMIARGNAIAATKKAEINSIFA